MELALNSEDKISESKKIAFEISSENKMVKKNALIKFQEFINDKNHHFTDEDFRNIFKETHFYFLNGLRDKFESVRIQALKFVKFLIIEKLPLSDFYLTYIFPVLVERIGTVELIEESEEMRYDVLQLLYEIITKYSGTEEFKPFLNDSVLILCETLKDPSPDIKELSCKSVVKLAEALPTTFHLQAETLLKPVIGCFSNRRFKIRVEAIKAAGEIIMNSSYKGVDEVMVPMAEKLFDQIPIVRQTVARVATRWMLEQRDRYSYFHKMLPLLLTCLNDEVESIRTESYKLWETVGLQYQKENETDLKDKLDYLNDRPVNYPNHLQRPNLGCRVLVQRHLSKIAPGVANELTSWQEDIRFRCSQLLCSLVLYAEEDLTFNLQHLLPAMYSAARDDDRRVVLNIIEASEIIGLFINPKTWSKLILPVIENGPHDGHFIVLAGLIQGAAKADFSDVFKEVCRLLSEDYICCCRKKHYQLALLKCVKVLEEKYNEQSKDDDSGYYLFKIITSLIALKDEENSAQLTPQLYDDLAHSLHLENRLELLTKYSNRLLQAIKVSPECWTIVNENACIFFLMITELNEAFSGNLDIISDILCNIFQEDARADAELKLKTFYVLAIAFEKKDVIFSRMNEGVTEFLEKLILDIFVPCLIWHAGKTAEVIRNMAATCLKYALSPIESIDLFSSADTLKQVADKLMPLLHSLMTDASYRGRSEALECLALLKENCVRKNIWNTDYFVLCYPEVLRRLDDPTDKVRMCALKCLINLSTNVPEEFLGDHYKSHRELIMDTLMLHFDDTDETVQSSVLEILKNVAKLNFKETIQKIETHRPLLRNQEGCDNILAFIESMH